MIVLLLNVVGVVSVTEGGETVSRRDRAGGNRPGLAG